MEPEPPRDLLDRLDPTARRNGPVRLRLGVGAAVVLLIVALVAAVVMSALGQQGRDRVVGPDGEFKSGASGSSGAETPGPTGSGTAGPRGAVIFVHVLGAVARPGLYELGEGSRVVDVIAAAGGMSDTADPAGVNLARLLSDGEQVYLPRLGEVPPPVATPSGGGARGSGGPVSLNAATAAELEELPRIGPAMAQRIIDYREANGPFTSVEELRQVTGIGDKTFEGLQDLVAP